MGREVVAEFFRDRRKPGRFNGGGGGGGSSKQKFLHFAHNHNPATFRGRGGVVGIFFCFFGNRRSTSSKLPQFREFFVTFTVHLEITRNSVQKKNIYRKFLGGGMAPLAPPGPPWLRHWPLDLVTCPNHRNFLFFSVVSRSS